PPTSARPGTPANALRRRVTVAVPAEVLPSAVGITLTSESCPRRNDDVAGANTVYTPGVLPAIVIARRAATGPPWVNTWIGNTTALGTPVRSSACRVCAGWPAPPSAFARGWPVFIDSAGTARPSTTASPTTPAIQRRRTIIFPH